MSEKTKKRIVTSLAALLVLLALISVCLLGTTMARYTSGGSGTGTVSVARWDVTADASALSTEVSFAATNGLSPKENSNGATNADLVNTTALVKVASINVGSNNGVDVDVYLTYTTPTITKRDTDTTYTDTQVLSALTIKVGYVTTDSTPSANELTALTMDNTSTVTLTQGTTYYIWAYASWTTAYTTNNSADALDTWIGTHVEKISTTITCQAVQGSEVNS